MNCRELIEFLADYLEGGGPAEQRKVFEGHLDLCSSCRYYLATYRASIELARSALAAGDRPSLEVPDELVLAVLAAIRTPPTSSEPG